MLDSAKLSPPVTESPWFWVMLFSLSALAGIATIGPKFERREESIETTFHGRERGLGREAMEKPADNAAPQVPHWEPIFTIQPVMSLIGIVALVAFVQVNRIQRRRFAELRSNEQATNH